MCMDLIAPKPHGNHTNTRKPHLSCYLPNHQDLSFLETSGHPLTGLVYQGVSANLELTHLLAHKHIDHKLFLCGSFMGQGPIHSSLSSLSTPVHKTSPWLWAMSFTQARQMVALAWVISIANEHHCSQRTRETVLVDQLTFYMNMLKIASFLKDGQEFHFHICVTAH